MLIARRRAGGRFGGCWEFPGGKIEPGEDPEACLSRELTEELGLSARIGRFVGAFPYRGPGPAIELLVYEAVPEPGSEPCPGEHEEIRWVRPEDLDRFDFAPPDRPVVLRLVVESAAEGPAAPERTRS